MPLLQACTPDIFAFWINKNHPRIEKENHLNQRFHDFGVHPMLGDGSNIFGGRFPFWRAYFSTGLKFQRLKPPTRMLMVPVAVCNPTRLPNPDTHPPEALVCGLGDTWQIHAFGSAANGFSSTESDLDVTCFLAENSWFLFFLDACPPWN